MPHCPDACHGAGARAPAAIPFVSGSYAASPDPRARDRDCHAALRAARKRWPAAAIQVIPTFGARYVLPEPPISVSLPPHRSHGGRARVAARYTTMYQKLVDRLGGRVHALLIAHQPLNLIDVVLRRQIAARLQIKSGHIGIFWLVDQIIEPDINLSPFSR